jgi:septal ring factor EnvC (AmiA/AmiB activator)
MRILVLILLAYALAVTSLLLLATNATQSAVDRASISRKAMEDVQKDWQANSKELENCQASLDSCQTDLKESYSSRERVAETLRVHNQEVPCPHVQLSQNSAPTVEQQ